MRSIKECSTCGRATNNAFMCRRCSNDLRDLLIGSREPDGQPGITWYVRRLRESAYGQTRMARSQGARSTNEGYAQLGNRRAYELLERISRVLAHWEGVVIMLRATHSHENGYAATGSPTRDSERLELSRARFIGANVILIRHHCREVNKLHAELLDCARQAWRIINRPNDYCCGPCPTMIFRPLPDSPYAASHDHVEACGTLLYAEDGAPNVQCPRCHTTHDVETLRNGLKSQVKDMLFTRSELVNLMETRLNDRIPQPTFTKLLRDGRLQARKLEEGKEPQYTYNDVVAARLKPVPHRRIQAS